MGLHYVGELLNRRYKVEEICEVKKERVTYRVFRTVGLFADRRFSSAEELTTMFESSSLLHRLAL